jgi:small GTP-binding protein
MQTILLKIIIVGECETGKSLLSKHLSDNNIISGYIPTIGLDMYVLRKELYNNINIKIHLWDTSGSPSYLNIIKSYFPACCAGIIIIDLSDENAINHTTKWIKELQNVKRNDNNKILISVFADVSKGVYNKNINSKILNICRKENVRFYEINLIEKSDSIILKNTFDDFFQLINKTFILNEKKVNGINYYINNNNYNTSQFDELTNTSLPLLENKEQRQNERKQQMHMKKLNQKHVRFDNKDCCSIL